MKKKIEKAIHNSKLGDTLQKHYLFKGKNGIGHDEEMYNAEVEDLTQQIYEICTATKVNFDISKIINGE